MKNIIIIDMQKGFINNHNRHIINRINDYLSSNTFDNIFYTKFINTKDSPFSTILNYSNMSTPNEQQIVVDLPQNAIELIKDTYGLTQEHIKLLKLKNIAEIEICGTDIDACCLAVAFNLFDNNIKPIILPDLCSTSAGSKKIYQHTLDIINRQFKKDNIKQQKN